MDHCSHATSARKPTHEYTGWVHAVRRFHVVDHCLDRPGFTFVTVSELLAGTAVQAGAEYRKLPTRVVDLHPLTIAQNARTSGGGNISLVPTKAITVGPLETWKAEKVSIWHAGMHDNPFGQRLTALMISKRIVDTAVPMSLLADHPNVQFNYFRGGIGNCDVEMH
jgi:hypothetical protein